MEYPEISNLQTFIDQHKVVIQKLTKPILEHSLVPLLFQCNGISYTIQVQDEYQDLNYNNSILDCLLVLRELAMIEDGTDYLSWCKLMMLDPNNPSLLDYYKTIVNRLGAIKSCFPEGEIDYYISDLDFQLSSGPMSVLRKP